MDVLEGVEYREARFDAEEHRGIPVRRMEVHEERRFPGGAVERGRDVDGHGRAADAALAAEHGEGASGHRAEHRPRHPPDRRFEIVDDDRFGHPLADAHAHGVEHGVRVERPGQDDDAGGGEVALQAHDFARQALRGADVDDEDVGALGAGDVARDHDAEIAVVDDEAAIAERRREVAFDGAEKGDGGLHDDYLTRATLMTNDDWGSAVMVLRGVVG